jgi:hypothetical protein
MRLRIAAQQGSPGRWLLGTAGAAAVEFALVTPFLVTLMVGGVDFGALFHTTQSIAAATRSGAQYARSSVLCQAGIQVLNTPQISTDCTTGIKNAVQSAGNFTPALTFPNAPVLACYCDGDGLTITCGDFSCATAVPSRGNNEVFVRVTARQAVTPLAPWPGFPATLDGLSELRLQ